eukprot:CAMPEP_0177719384 /NCGR_PEP_ID=MMETSP0484_2-20121128/16074_1 /TAXON_ID=354590 /ORGANISM="Rhodomonas lens, Strain RHODO" /LENGTH=201 /DNA_ID=CAMNT_0019231597 /DNA_START=16 /DNA_END=621 /DNA_ORIENTATION=+
MAARSRLLPLAMASSRQALRPAVHAAFGMGAPSVLSMNSSLWSVGGIRTTKSSKRNTKIILTTDYEHLGHRGDEVQVRPGYARNFLIPKQIAVYSTVENQNKFLVEKSAEEQRIIDEARKKAETRRRLERLKLTLKRQVTGETMYGSVSAKDIARILSLSGVDVVEHDVKLEKPIKELGAHTVSVKISGELQEVPFSVVKR